MTAPCGGVDAQELIDRLPGGGCTRRACCRTVRRRDTRSRSPVRVCRPDSRSRFRRAWDRWSRNRFVRPKTDRWGGAASQSRCSHRMRGRLLARHPPLNSIRLPSPSIVGVEPGGRMPAPHLPSFACFATIWSRAAQTACDPQRSGVQSVRHVWNRRQARAPDGFDASRTSARDVRDRFMAQPAALMNRPNGGSLNETVCRLPCRSSRLTGPTVQRDADADPVCVLTAGPGRSGCGSDRRGRASDGLRRASQR